MTKNQLNELLGIIDEIQATVKQKADSVSADKSEANDKPECFDVEHVKSKVTGDMTSSHLFRGKICNDMSVVLSVEQHKEHGIRLEMFNGVPATALKRKFKEAILHVLAGDYPFLRTDA